MYITPSIMKKGINGLFIQRLRLVDNVLFDFKFIQVAVYFQSETSDFDFVGRPIRSRIMSAAVS